MEFLYNIINGSTAQATAQIKSLEGRATQAVEGAVHFLAWKNICTRADDLRGNLNPTQRSSPWESR